VKTQTSLTNGITTATIYLLNYSIDKNFYRKSLEIIKRDIFKHKMSVIFTFDGIVKSFYTKCFFDSMGLKDIEEHLFVHLDCGYLNDIVKNNITNSVMNNDTYSYLNSILSDIFTEYNEELKSFRKELDEFKENN